MIIYCMLWCCSFQYNLTHNVFCISWFELCYYWSLNSVLEWPLLCTIKAILGHILPNLPTALRVTERTICFNNTGCFPRDQVTSMHGRVISEDLSLGRFSLTDGSCFYTTLVIQYLLSVRSYIGRSLNKWLLSWDMTSVDSKNATERLSTNIYLALLVLNITLCRSMSKKYIHVVRIHNYIH